MKRASFPLAILSLVAASALLSQPVYAVFIPIPNGSFESGTPPYPLSATPGIPNWTNQANQQAGVVDAATAFGSVSGPASWSNGSYGLIATGTGAPGQRILTNNTTLSLAANTTYIYSVDVAGTSNYQGVKMGLSYGSQIFMETNLNAGNRTTLTANTLTGTGLVAGSASAVLSAPITNGSWSTITITFTTNSSITSLGNLGFYIGVGNGHTQLNTDYTAFDNVRLEAVPEPGTIALAGLGLGAVFFFRRRAATR